MKYNIPKISRNIFPHFWQNDENLSLLDVLQGTLNFVNNAILENETQTLIEVGYSSQRLSLEISLNNQFDSQFRRISVINGNVGGSEFIFNDNETPIPEDIIYIFNENESTPSGATTPYFYNENESGSPATAGFTVSVPDNLMELQREIMAWIDRVNAFGITYNIIYQ